MQWMMQLSDEKVWFGRDFEVTNAWVDIKDQIYQLLEIVLVQVVLMNLEENIIILE